MKRKLILTVAFVVAFFIGVATDASGKTKTVTTAAKTVGSEAKSNVVALDPKTGNIIARFRCPKTVGSEAKSNVVALDPKTGNIIARFRCPKTVGSEARANPKP